MCLRRSEPSSHNVLCKCLYSWLVWRHLGSSGCFIILFLPMFHLYVTGSGGKQTHLVKPFFFAKNLVKPCVFGKLELDHVDSFHQLI
jgi:hypothetical protein